MNKVRRGEIARVIEAAELLKEAIELILSDEQEYLDNMPESFQGGEKGDKAQEAIDSLEMAMESADQVIAELEGAGE